MNQLFDLVNLGISGVADRGDRMYVEFVYSSKPRRRLLVLKENYMKGENGVGHRAMMERLKEKEQRWRLRTNDSR